MLRRGRSTRGARYGEPDLEAAAKLACLGRRSNQKTQHKCPTPHAALPVRGGVPDCDTDVPERNTGALRWGALPRPEPSAARFDPVALLRWEITVPGCASIDPNWTVCVSRSSLFSPDPHQPLLRDARDQQPVAREDRAAREAARTGHDRAFLRVEQPVFGAERPVQPERMVEAAPMNSFSNRLRPCGASAKGLPVRRTSRWTMPIENYSRRASRSHPRLRR